MPLPFDPLGILGGLMSDVVTDMWVGVCMAVWAAGLWLMRTSMIFIDSTLSPSLSPTNPDGSPNPLTQVYGYCLWIALLLAVLLTMVQVAVTVFRRDANSLGQLLVGAGQYILVSVSWFTVSSAVVVASSGVNRALMQTLLGVNQWSKWQPFSDDVMNFNNNVGSGIATVLLVMGLLMCLASIFQLLVYLGRAVALLILSATAPIMAAGLMSAVGQPWFWKALRWYLAAVWSPPLMTLVLGIGITVTNGVAFAFNDSAQEGVALGIAGVVTILASVVSPLGLFKLLAFVDPNTSSGANYRSVHRHQRESHTSDQAQKTDPSGRSVGEGTAQQTPRPGGGGTGTNISSPQGGVASGGTEANAGSATAGQGAGGAGGAAAAGGAVAAAGGAVAAAAVLAVKAFFNAGEWAASNVADTTSQMGTGAPVWPQDLRDDRHRQVVGQQANLNQPRSIPEGSDGSDSV